jgi:hypothetical protein
MRVRYAVVWQQDDGPRAAGRLELAGDALHFEGAAAAQDVVADVPYADLRSANIGRGADERLDGRPALVLDRRSGGRIRVACVAQTMLLAELADHVASTVLR